MFWDLLKRNFGGNLKADYPSPGYHFFPPSAVEWSLRQFRYTCYTSHNYRLSSLPALDDHEIVAISFTRDPVSKFLSNYFYSRQRPETGPWYPSKHLDLTEFLRRLLDEPEFSRLPLDVSQAEFLRGDLPAGPLPALLEQPFGPVHLFPAERFDDALICLERLYPTDFTDCSYGERANTSHRDQTVTQQHLDMIERLPWIAADRDLNRFSHECLDECLAGAFGGDGELEAAREDFTRRCRERSSAAAEARGKPHAASPASGIKKGLKQRVRLAARMLFTGR